jgi:hypothetical protein
VNAAVGCYIERNEELTLQALLDMKVREPGSARPGGSGGGYIGEALEG